MIPTRNRFDKLLNCITSISKQIGLENISEVEFLVKFDSDDQDSLSKIPTLPTASLPIKVLISDKLGGYKDLFHFYNDLAMVSCGTFLMMWNDDATFKTENWYEIFKQQVRAEQTALSYWFGGTPTLVAVPGDAPRQEDWPCFIAHHRLFYQILGFYGHQGGVDSFLYYVLGPLNLLKKIDAIQVDHLAWFQIPEQDRDVTANENATEGAMLPTNFNVVKSCQEKIRLYAMQQTK